MRLRRAQLRERRHKASVPTVALVGYTNAGKTTLFNVLTRAGAEASDALFVTLDPLIRQVRLPDSRALLVSDTVGFIDRLPHALVAAFRATLEAVADADLILHVIDASAADRDRRMDAVRQVLEEVGATEVPMIEVYNKCDALNADERRRLQDRDPAALCISARDRDGIDDLIETVTSRLALDVRRMTLTFDPGDPADRERMARALSPRPRARPRNAGRARVDRRRRASAAGGSLVVQAFGEEVEFPPCPFEPPAGCFVAPLRSRWRSSSVRAPRKRRRRCRLRRRAKFPEFIQPPVPRSLAANPAAVTSQQRGWQFLQAGDLRTAEREFKLALAVAPQFYPAETSLGYLELARKEAADALPHFEKALALDGRDVSALVGGGLAFLALNRESDALFAFESAVAVDPSLVDIKRRVEVLRFRGLGQDLAAARQAAADGKLDDAARAYASAIASSPDSPFLYRELAVVERRQGNTEAALGDFRKALALDPTDAGSSVGVGDLLAERGDLEGAEKAYTDALLLEPSEAVDAKLDGVRARIELARLPAEYRAIDTAAQITRGDLAALIGVRLAPFVQSARRREAIVITDTRNHWASTWIMAVARAGIVDPYDNHTFQPRSRRASHGPRAGDEPPAVAHRGGEPGAGAGLGVGAPPVLRSVVGTPGLSGGVDGRRGRGDEDRARQRVLPVADRQRGRSRRRHRPRGSAGQRAAAGRPEPGARSPGPEMTGPGPFTTANQITLLRMLLIPAFVTLVIYHELGWALIVFATAGISDAARRPHRAEGGAEDEPRRVARSHGRQAAARQHVRRADGAGARPHEPPADLADGARHQPRRPASS